ncbi:MAG: alpha/beta hydrolase [Treponema sp.]|nr:alpha/beta hydrolase [Treponema sp.]
MRIYLRRGLGAPAACQVPIQPAPVTAVCLDPTRPAPASDPASTSAAILLAAALLASVSLAACSAPAPREEPSIAEGAAPGDGLWITARDGTLLRVHVREPADPARGILLMVPGVTGLDARMEAPVTEPLAAAGFAVYALEPRGTGESGGPRGYAGNASLILDDLGRFAARARERAGQGGTAEGLPVFLFGHSMGGTFALALAAEMDPPPAGLVLVNPAYKYRPLKGATPGFGDYLRFAAYWIFAPRKPVVDMGGDPSLLEDPDDRAEAAERKASPAVQGLQSMASMTAARRIITAAPRNAGRLSAPGLIVEGKRDLLIDPAGTDEIAAAWGGRSIERVRVDGAHGRSSALAGMEAILGWLLKEAGR